MSEDGGHSTISARRRAILEAARLSGRDSPADASDAEDHDGDHDGSRDEASRAPQSDSDHALYDASHEGYEAQEELGPGDDEEDDPSSPLDPRTARMRRLAFVGAAVAILASGAGYWALSREPEDAGLPQLTTEQMQKARDQIAQARAAAQKSAGTADDTEAAIIEKVPAGLPDGGRTKAPRQLAANDPSASRPPGRASDPPADVLPKLVPEPPPSATAPPPGTTPILRADDAADRGKTGSLDNPFAVGGVAADPAEIEAALGGLDPTKAADPPEKQIEAAAAAADPRPASPPVIPGARLDQASQYGGRITLEGRTIEYRMHGAAGTLGTALELRPWKGSWELLTDAGIVRPAGP